MNIPNILTFFRILLVPVFVTLIIYEQVFYAFLVFIIAGVTDVLDGFIARVFNQKTDLGAHIDPIADKLLLVTSYIILAIKGIIPPWLSVLVISRDIFILTGVLILFLNHKSVEIKPTFFGKASTLIQVTTVVIALSVSQLHVLQPFLIWSIYLAAVLTLFSGFHYAVIWIGKMKE